MSRNDYNYGMGKMGNNQKQNQMIKDSARQVGISSEELSKEVHRTKDDWYEGDFSYSELLEIARKIKEKR